MVSENNKNIEIRLIIEPEDELYPLFIEAKKMLALKSNSETARYLIKKAYDVMKKSNL